MDDETTVLIVEDEAAVVDSYELMLEDDYSLLTAYDGEEALALLDEVDVDVVLLDRMMPGMSGDEVLAEIRDSEVDCRVAMVTAVDPDFDILEMGFDGYVSKPPTETALRETIEELLETGEYGDRVREYRSLLEKQSTLEAQKDEAELEASEAFAELEQRIETLRRELDENNEQLLDDRAFVSALRDLDDDAEGAYPGE